MLHCRIINSLYEITNHAEPRCYTVEYNIQTVYMKLQIMLSQGAVEYNIQTVYMKLQIMFKVLHCRVQYTISLYEITNHAEPRCYTVEYNIQTVCMK